MVLARICRYIATRPYVGDEETLQVIALDEYATYKFINFQKYDNETYYFPFEGRDDIVDVTLPMLDAATIRNRLAEMNDHLESETSVVIVRKIDPLQAHFGKFGTHNRR